MKKFEVPYNFENDYFDKLSSLDSKYFDYIKFIYLPAFKEHNVQNSREEFFNCKNYNDLISYKEILKKIKSFNIDIALLIQRGATIDIIEKYYNEFNIKYFIINDDSLAKEIKSKYGKKIYLILSVTRILKYDDIINKDLSMYDEIVLYFWFNKHLDYIKKLPSKYNYSILVNSECIYNCKFPKIHWFNKKEQCRRYNKEYSIFIDKNDLIYFDRYINSFKLVDRTFPSQKIIDELIMYIEGYININNIKFDKNMEDHYNLNDDSEFKPI